MGSYRAFLFPEASVEGDSLLLDVRESHHLVRVLRARVGDAIEVLDGRGQRFAGRVAVADGRALRMAVEKVTQVPRRTCELTLLQSIPKGKTMDLILRMATEIGATRVQPVFTEQGEVQMQGERLSGKVDKWRVTMIEACKQCGLAYLPELERPVGLRDWLAGGRSGSLAGAGALSVVASLEVGSRPLRTVLGETGEAGPWQSVTVAVGPEGDFSRGEYAALAAAGFRPVRLGANVLRAETAAAYTLSVIDQWTEPGD